MAAMQLFFLCTGSVATALSPLRYASFRCLVIANQVANIGMFAYAVGVTWILVEKNQTPGVVALVQTASMAPFLLLSLIGGLLADFYDRRLVQLLAQVWSAGLLLILAGVTVAGFASPAVVLALTFLVGVGKALRAPAWQASIPSYVPRNDVTAAVTLCSSAFSVSRAIGPVIGGVLLVLFSAAGVFIYSAMSAVVLVAALHRSPALPATGRRTVPPGLHAGINYVCAEPAIRVLLARTLAVCVPAAAGLALLPVVVAGQLGGGAYTYGVLLGSFGFGAVVGAVSLPACRRRWTPNSVLNVASLCFALVLIVLATARSPFVTGLALVLGGASWVAILATLNAVVHLASSPLMRGRTLSAYITCSFGGLSVGSALWGGVAETSSVAASLIIAAGLLALSSAPLRRLTLPNISPSDPVNEPRATAAGT